MEYRFENLTREKIISYIMFFHTSDKSGTGKYLILIGMGLAGLCATGLLWMNNFS